MTEITVSSPKKILTGDLTGVYACDVYLPDIKKTCSIYSNSSTSAVSNASNFVETYLKEKINRLECILNARDVRQELLEDLEWSKRALAEHEKRK